MRILLALMAVLMVAATVAAGTPAPGTHAQATQVLVLDDDAIDNGSASIEELAATLPPPMDDPARLVNDDIASYTVSQALPIPPGTVLTLPSGQAGDEGFFSLPPSLPFTLADYLNGLIPQSALDPVDGV